LRGEAGEAERGRQSQMIFHLLHDASTILALYEQVPLLLRALTLVKRRL
jgi:hypothetical protein